MKKILKLIFFSILIPPIAPVIWGMWIYNKYFDKSKDNNK